MWRPKEEAVATRIRSEEGEWKRISRRWGSNDATSLARDLNAGLRAAGVVIEAAGGIGVRIGLNVSQSVISGLEQDRQMMEETTGRIHDEAVALIDKEFVLGLSGVLDSLYALNPGDFTAEYAYEDGSAAIYSLRELTTAALAEVDIGLIRDFRDKLDALDKDTVPEDMARIILDIFLGEAELAESMGLEPDEGLLQTIIDMISSINAGKDITEVIDADKVALLKYYRMAYPEKAKKFDQFFKGVEMEGDSGQNIKNIMYLAYCSPEPFHTLFFDNLDDAKLGHIAPYTDEGGKSVSDFGFFKNGEINTDLARDDRFRAARAFFHEYGHYLDDKFGNASAPLRGSVFSDAYDNITKEIRKETTNPEEVRLILDSLKYGGEELADEELNKIRNTVINVYYDKETQTGLLSDKYNIVASDVYGGATNNNVHGLHYHFPDTEEYQEDRHKYYWYDDSGEETGKHAKEYFAESFSNGMTQNEKALKNADIFFPNANKEFAGLVTAMSKKDE
jgi:hypothetical protein